MNTFRAARNLGSKALTALGFALLTALPCASAQQVGANISFTYGIEELEKRPAILNLAPGYLTTLRFDEAVIEATAGKPDLVSAEGFKSDPNKLILRAKLLAGRTDLSVTTETGRTVNFILNINRGVSGALYYIKNPVTRALPASPALNLANQSLANSQSSDLTLVTQLQLDGTGHLIVNYAINNPYDYALEIASVRLLDATGSLPLRMENFESLLEANSSQTGRTTVLRTPKSKLTLEIGLKNAAGTSSYLKRDLDAASLIKLAGK